MYGSSVALSTPDVSHGFVLVVRKAGTVNIWVERTQGPKFCSLVRFSVKTIADLGGKKVAPTKSSSANYGSIVDLLFLVLLPFTQLNSEAINQIYITLTSITRFLPSEGQILLTLDRH